MKMIIGAFFGFVAGVVYGTYQFIEVEDGMAIKTVKALKVLIKGMVE
jgi:hypothetical protein